MEPSATSHTDVNKSPLEVWEEYPVGKMCDLPDQVGKSRLSRFYRSQLIPFSVRHKLWHVLNKSLLDQEWLEKLNSYWGQVLGARPILGPLDFAFFQGVWRQKFYQYCKVIEYDTGAHLQAWQKPELLYQLINLTYRESFQSHAFTALAGIKNFKKKAEILEFGAAIAPVTEAIMKFGMPYKKIHIADIETFAFHYGCYRNCRREGVIPIPLKEENDFNVPTDVGVDIIFCLEVFEHLPKPMQTVRRFHDMLSEDGILVFDYIRSDAEGLDTPDSLTERPAVLKYIKQNFSTLEGDMADISKTVSLCVVKKK